MHIGFIDSGIGGLTTLSECLKNYPHFQYSYIADTAFAPYGSLDTAVLEERIEYLISFLLSKNVDAIVLACNTASVSTLFKNWTIPIIRALPEIESALENTIGRVILLCTPVTSNSVFVERRSTNRLSILADKDLATKIERCSPHFSTLREYVKMLLSPLLPFDGLILGCTHFIHLKPLLLELFPNVKLFDSNSRIIDEVGRLDKSSKNEKNCVTIYYT